MPCLRECCATLYFIEQYREGHPLPLILPTGIQNDEALKFGAKVQIATHHLVVVSGIPWQHNPNIFNLLQFFENIPMVQTLKSKFISSCTLVL